MSGNLKQFWTDRRVLFISFMFVVYVCFSVFTPGSRWTWIAIMAGVLFFFFVEYFTHRFILHGYFAKVMPNAYKGHEDHHDHPNELAYMLTPNGYNVPLHLVFWAVFSAALWNIHLGSAVMVGTCGYQLYYEWTHFVSHRPIKPLTPWGRWMKKYHLLHHYKHADYWFGVTNSALDKVCGTYASPKSPEVSQTKRQLHS